MICVAGSHQDNKLYSSWLWASQGNLRTQQIQTQDLFLKHFWIRKQGKSSGSWTILNLVTGIIGRVFAVSYACVSSPICHHFKQLHRRRGLFNASDLKLGRVRRTERHIRRSCEVPLCLLSDISSHPVMLFVYSGYTVICSNACGILSEMLQLL